MKKLPVCDDLFNSTKEIETWKYCVPIFIASSFFGTFICDTNDLIPDKFNKTSIRNGTLTFVSYNGETFAITCKHVLDALENQQKLWKKDQIKKYGFEPPIEGLQLFTPINNYQYHFNYKLSPVPKRDDGAQPDIAIARVNFHSIQRLNRQPIVLTQKDQLPETGIASGYPEQQREIQKGVKLYTFSPKFVNCIASLQVTSKGDLLIHDTIVEHNGLDVLSGMSGGPIIWSDLKEFGLAGIVREGLDIQSKESQIMTEDGICIYGERITPELFDHWLDGIPELLELKDESKMLYIPKGMPI